MAYAFYRSETVQASQVTGTLPDFPAWFERTLNEFRTIGNGGNVANASGRDLNLWTNSGGAPGALMKQETEIYVAATGHVGKWGKVASIAVGTVVWWQYGDSGITTDQDDPPNVWPSQYVGVWHLADGGNSVLVGSTAGGYTLTNSGSGVADAAGKIGRGAYFSGAFTSLANASIPTPASIAVSWWQYVATADVGTSGSSFGGTSPSDRVLTHHPYSDNNLYWDYGNATDGQGRVHTSYSSYLDAWTFVTLVYDNSSSLHAIYLNGALIASHTHADDETALTGGVILGSLGSFWTGTMDEARIANAGPSADWIAAEYNNQSAPTSFWGLGSELTVGGSGTFLQHPGMAGGLREMAGGMRGYRPRPRRRHTQNPDFQVRAA